jgi:AcrR family transcriptional regulator
MSVAEQQAGTSPRSGRPRDRQADRAILRAALHLLAEHGYDALTVEGVAAASGVAKTTIYRRYASKRELVAAALASLVADHPVAPETGDPRADLLAVVRSAIDVAAGDEVGYVLLGTLLATERREPQLLALFREVVLAPRLERAAHALRRGIDAGMLRADLPVETAIELAMGALLARHLVGRQPDESWLDDVMTILWTGAVARPIPGLPRSGEPGGAA